MSYDGYLTIDTGGDEAVVVVEIGNYTSNVTWMWHRAFQHAGEDILLSETSSRLAIDMVPLLAKAVEHMRAHPDEYREMEPPNGWGNYDGALRYLERTLELCREHPKTTLRWSA